MRYDLYLQLAPDAPSDIRERIADLLEPDSADEEFPCANEAVNWGDVVGVGPNVVLALGQIKLVSLRAVP